MAKSDLSLKPFQVKHGWYYEEAAGFSVVSPFTGADIIVIPWSKILASVRRYKKPKRKKKI